MPIFGSTIGVALGSSGSYNLPTTSSIPGLVFVYTVPTSSNTFVTSSVASIEANIINADQTGSSGELIFRVPSPEDATSKGETILKISSTGSNNEPRVGIGIAENQTLEGFLDLRSPTGSSPVSIVLRTNEDGVIEDGEETGRITFAIESSSYLGTGFIASGSTAAIYSRVIQSNINGAYGNLVFEVNDNSAVTEPIEAMTIGYGEGASSTDVGVNISGSLSLKATTPYIFLTETTNNSSSVYLGSKIAGFPPGAPFDQGILYLYNDGDAKIILDSNGNSYINTGNNFGVGTTSPGEKLTVEGNISASGNIYVDELHGDGSNITGLPSAAITTYTNSGNNRLITSVDSTTVNGESNLTFDGSTLEVTGDISASGDITASNLFITDTATYNTVEFTNSNIMKFNQRYTGGATGSYFTNGEYQKVVTITPSAASENYQVVGRMTAQNAGETHTVYFNAALRSVTLTDLTWTINYDEEYNGSRYLDPQLWVKETSTAGFIIAFKTLATIFGSVTIDFDVIPRNASQKANVIINQVTDSEQPSVDTGFTAYDMQRNLRNQNGNFTISGSLTAQSATVDDFTINDTLTADTVTGSLLRLSENGSGLRLTNVGGFEPQSGVFNIFGNNDVTFGAGGSGASERVLTLVESNRHAQFEAAVSASVFSGSFVGDGSNITNITVAASDITGLVDISSQTNLAAGDGIDLTGDTISADVISVAGQTGAVTLTADDISDTGTTNKFTTQADITKLSNLNISGSGDFVNNEFIVAVGTNAVTSSDALAVDSAGNLGIGTSTPEVRLHMLGEAAQTTQILMEQFNNTQDAPDIRTRRYRGTEASPSDVQTGDYLFRLNVHGQDGGSSELYGSMRFDVDGSDQDALEWGLQTRDTTGTVADRITIDSAGDTIIAGEVSSNTIKNIETTLASDSATNVDTFATATYKGAIYDYVLYDAGVGARTGQFMVIQDNSSIDFTDNSTPTIGSEATIPSITAVINGSNVEVKVTNGNGYTFKAMAKKL